MNRLKEKYVNEIVPSLLEKHDYKSIMGKKVKKKKNILYKIKFRLW